ncbi:aminopeptidase P family protein [Larsenimonas salina]|uniref:aminopeptidase P family protein n=1 Tax=Larsenimonas salina TaxID=1295565 RepID=UPI002073441E|nr:aminopeptidase P family protein [Larsenimonas salina]MCM5705156.1 aminopeptidase P family protein [Larsenimonas salina]
MSAHTQRLDALRHAMQAHRFDGWWLPSDDPHLSEYLPAHWQGRAWLSGFTGSVGLLTITQDKAALWVDSRYWVQAEQQLAGSGIALEKWSPRDAEAPMQWFVTHLPKNSRIGADGAVLSLKEARTLNDVLQPASLKLDTTTDLLDHIWSERPALPNAPIYCHDSQWVGESTKEKLSSLRSAMTDQGADAHLLSALDDIAWLTNLRGSDVEYNPVFLAHMLITQDQATLFIEGDRLDREAHSALEQAGIEVAPYEDAARRVAELSPSSHVLIDPSKLTLLLADAVPESADLIEASQPTTLAKSRKGEMELAHVRDAMEDDGVALCEFFAWLDEALTRGEAVSELTIDDRLREERQKRPNFVGESFPTIAGFNQNGALPHYRASEEAFSHITGKDGLLLIDSGGQYLGGTTDITRMVPVGHLSSSQRDGVTRVLKGLIALSSAHFPEDIPAPQLDAIARNPLWQAGLDYGHGTGHGVGYFLNVHEGPQVISWQAGAAPRTAMKAGMITSIEPGLYREGEWGVRIENLVANRATTHNEFGRFLEFETLTLCPIDTRALNLLLLNEDERAWLNHYHSVVHERLSARRMTTRALEWLQRRTLPV